MSILFEETKIKNMVIRNRFIRSATVDNGAASGRVSEGQMKLYTNLAAGKIGLLITGMICVHYPDHITPFQNLMAWDDCIPDYNKLTAAVHRHGGKIAAQLAHSGRQKANFVKDGEELALAPSFVENDPYFKSENYRAATEEEIWEIIKSFGEGAKRAQEAGFDAVQIHGAHAFLLAQFLSPYTNHRDDKWGGSLENRLRIHCEIYKAIREKVGNEYPVLIKLGVQDGFYGGLDFVEGRKAALILAKLGFDALEISQGLRGKHFEETEFRTQLNGLGREAYFRDWCSQIKGEVSVPVMMVGGLRTFSLMEEIVKKGEADYVSLCRPFIREPGIVDDWEKDNSRKAKCTSCNRCIEELQKQQEMLCCVQEKTDGK